MSVGPDQPTAFVRPTWLAAIIEASQHLAGQCQQLDVRDAHRTLTAFVAHLPTPSNAVERLILRAILLDVAWRCGDIVHACADRECAVRCDFVPATLLARFWRVSGQDPRRVFLGWVEAFSAELTRTHPPSAAARAAHVIRDDYQQRWSIAVLAERFDVTPSQLRRTFQRQFGVSIREYQRTMRLIEALEHVSTEKIDAIALQVGYKSKKNFYRAFQHVTGLTPTAFRSLPEERVLHVVESLRAAPPRRAYAADRRRRAGTIADRRQ